MEGNLLVRSDFGNEESGGVADADDRRAKARALFAFLDRAAADSRITGTQFRILYVISQRENQRTSQEMLSGLVGGLKERMLRIATKGLRLVGYIGVDTGSGPGAPSRYRTRQSIAALPIEIPVTQCRVREKGGNGLPPSSHVQTRQSIARNPAIHCKQPGNELPTEVSRELPKRRKKVSRAVALDLSDDVFERDVWPHWPRKIKKDEALKSWRKAARQADPKLIAERAQLFAAACDPHPDRRQFIPHLSTWLNQARWKDEIEPTHTTGLNHHDQRHVAGRAGQQPTNSSRALAGFSRARGVLDEPREFVAVGHPADTRDDGSGPILEGNLEGAA